MIDLTGSQVNNLTVLEEVFSQNGKRWKCQCKCGKEISVDQRKLTTKRQMSCGCIRKNRPQIKKRKPLLDKVKNEIYSDYLFNAKKRNLTFNIDIEEFWTEITKDCHYCGEKPSKEHTHKFSNDKIYTNGIDRKNNEIGYEKNNIVPCCSRCNFLKNKYNYDKFINLIKLIYENKFSG